MDEINELKQKIELSDELLDGASFCIAVYRAIDDGQNFEIVRMNRTAEITENVKQEDVLGKLVTEVFPGVKDFGLLETFKQVFKTGSPEHHPVSQYKDDRIVGWRANYVYRLSNGDVVAVYSDVTGKKKAEQKLIESEEKYRLIFESAANLMIVLSPDGLILDCNKRISDFIGYEKKDVVGHYAFEFVHPDYLDHVKKSFAQVLAEGYLHDNTFKIVSRKGSVLDISVTSSLISENNAPLKIISIADDVTDKKRREREVHKLNDRMIGRELKMLELESENEQLRNQLKFFEKRL
ncbi:PAS domain S-box protein [Candidatus Pacearchaeota archaeon]|nr:PAS domain S-box protein [Candidatus Pacearchaeota archaeon]